MLKKLVQIASSIIVCYATQAAENSGSFSASISNSSSDSSEESSDKPTRRMCSIAFSPKRLSDSPPPTSKPKTPTLSMQELRKSYSIQFSEILESGFNSTNSGLNINVPKENIERLKLANFLSTSILD